MEPAAPCDTDVLRRSVRRVSEANGEFLVPAIPGTADDYVRMMRSIADTTGTVFDHGQQQRLKSRLVSEIDRASRQANRSNIVISYMTHCMSTKLHWQVESSVRSPTEFYGDWTPRRRIRLFGARPDARVMEVAREAPVPAECRVLDVGAGEGRNSLALARRGHPVDALEPVAAYGHAIAKKASRKGLKVRVIPADLTAAGDGLSDQYGLIVASQVTAEFTGTTDLRRLFELAGRHLTDGGALVLNVFTPTPGRRLDSTAIQLSRYRLSSTFTALQLDIASRGCGLVRVSDDPVYAYEKARSPWWAWPPTPWYRNWTNGLDVFDTVLKLRALELRWMVYRKTDGHG